MQRIVCLVLGLSFAAGVAAQDKYEKKSKSDELKDPIAILKKVDAATKKVKTVQYDAKHETKGRGDGPTMTVAGSVIMSGKAMRVGAVPSKFWMKLKAEMPSGEKHKFVIGSDGDEYYLFDPKKKTAYVDIDSSVLGNWGELAGALIMVEYVHPTPFSDELDGDKAELRESKKIGGEDCYQIFVVYKDSQGSAIWFFSKKDFLPRRVVRIEQGSTTTLTNVKPDPKLEKDVFKVKIPEGYTKTDEPAP